VSIVPQHSRWHPDYGNDSRDGARNSVKRQLDYTDYGNDASATSFRRKCVHDYAGSEQQEMKAVTPCKQEALSQEDCHQQESAVISDITVINRNQCHHHNQWHVSEPSLDI
jgi:hypothetical protein